MSTATATTTCESCTYWKAATGSEGQCRRQPPFAISFKVDEGVKFESQFPVTQAADWCGEYSAK